jgi:hypothetical protein
MGPAWLRFPLVATSMNRCSYCGAEYPDDTTECPLDHNPMQQAVAPALRAKKRKREISSVPAMEGQNQEPISRYPFEYWVMLALVLGQSDWGHLLFAAFFWYMILKWKRPGSDFEPLMVASGHLGNAIVRAELVFMWGRSPYSMIEPVALSGVALALLYTRRRGWAWLLLVVASFEALVFLLPAISLVRKQLDAQPLVIAALIDLLWVWLLVCWLRRKRGAANPQGGANGRQPLRSDTNPTAEAAASRRSP